MREKKAKKNAGFVRQISKMLKLVFVAKEYAKTKQDNVALLFLNADILAMGIQMKAYIHHACMRIVLPKMRKLLLVKMLIHFV